MSIMSRARLEHASLFYHIKDGFLAKDWSVEVTNEPLDFDTKTNVDGSVYTHYRLVTPDKGSYVDLPTSKGRGWVYLEPKEYAPCAVYNPTISGYVPAPQGLNNTTYSIPQKQEESLIVVRDENGDIIPREQYDIDYISGRIRHFDPAISGSSLPPGKVVTSGVPTSIDYRFHLVGVIDGWPDDENPPPHLPFVVVYTDSSLKKPLQIGPGVISSRRFIIDVFAQNSGQREDLLDGLEKILYNRHAPVIDFNRTGPPLRHNGTFNQDFIQTLNVSGQNYRTYLTLNGGNGNRLYFINTEVQYNTTPRISRSEIGKFRGRVIVTTETNSDRGTDSVVNLSGETVPIGGFDSLRAESYSS